MHGIHGTVGGDPIGVAIHEFGHVATDRAERDDDVELAALDRSRVRAAEVHGDRSKYREHIEREVSFYASTERSELTAEAFADVVQHGIQASELSHEIYAMVTGRADRPARPDLRRPGREARSVAQPGKASPRTLRGPPPVAPPIAVPNLDRASTQLLLDAFRRISSQPPGTPGVAEALAAVDAELARRESVPSTAVVDTPQSRRVDDLIAKGWGYLDAYAEVHGLDVRKLEREQRMQIVDAERLPGERRAHTIRRMYAEMVALAHAQAEDETRGNLLNRVGRAAGIDPATLWSGPSARARKYASDELKAWWEDHGGRITATEFAAQFTGDRAAAERVRAAGQGRDYGI